MVSVQFFAEVPKVSIKQDCRVCPPVRTRISVKFGIVAYTKYYCSNNLILVYVSLILNKHYFTRISMELCVDPQISPRTAHRIKKLHDTKYRPGNVQLQFKTFLSTVNI
jgi:hypothetical protein